LTEEIVLGKKKLEEEAEETETLRQKVRNAIKELEGPN